MIRIGVDLSRGRARVVALERKGSEPFELGVARIGEDLTRLADLMGQRGAGRRGRSVVTVAVGADRSQWKALGEIPTGTPPTTVTGAATHGIGRFFLLPNGRVPSLTEPSRWRGEAWWIGAIDARLVEDLRAVCDEAGIWVLRIVPSVALLDRPVTLLPDVHLAFLATTDGDRPVVCRRRLAALGGASGDAEVATPSDLALAAAQWTGAALEIKCARARRGSRRRKLAISAALASTAVLALAAPPVSSSYRQRAYATELATLAHVRADVVRAQATLGHLASGLEALADLGTRPRAVEALASFSRRLPQHAALDRFEADSTGMRFRVVSQGTGDVIRALSGRLVDGIEAVEIDGRPYERAVVRVDSGGVH